MIISLQGPRRVAVLVLVAATVLVYLLIARSERLKSTLAEYYQRAGGDRDQSHHDAPHRQAQMGNSSLCDGFPDMSRVAVAMKTGASEAFARIPTQLMTTMSCLPDFLLFSDMDQEIGGYHLIDSLQNVLPSVKSTSKDFELYRRQQECLIDVEKCNTLLGNPAKEGWKLDKYKFTHIAEMTYRMRPGYDWYVFIEADTYVLFENMARWLSTMDPSKKLYLGGVSVIRRLHFAYGGSGYIVSQAAMAEFIGNHPGVANDYDLATSKECCGDFVFAKALKETTGIGVQQMYPTMTGDRPTTMGYGYGLWCQPLASMHHMNSEAIATFWKFERQWHQSHPNRTMLMKDVYAHFVAPKIQSRLPDWDNLSADTYYIDPKDKTHDRPKNILNRVKDPKKKKYNDLEKKAHLTAASCEAACGSVGEKECFQWRYEDGLCAFHKSIRLGQPVKGAKKENLRVTSGWNLKRIEKFIEAQRDCEGKEAWPKPKIEG
ncbi:hypothetical protein B0T16DRAFT_421088 [Cercophora newfieldiana]|uniref:Glycosyltransferase family 31 protein n=1 Tax=Cercophora newfieldiana TaxID=92897 RepID=A0AA39XZ03_9PEZI|nr:hypothetical protein B0T16DRAFT_421088 [Cercophora newfieldiana]